MYIRNNHKEIISHRCSPAPRLAKPALHIDTLLACFQHLGLAYRSYSNLIVIIKQCTHMAASKLTHFRNAVLLVWGSLRLAPIIIKQCTHLGYLIAIRGSVLDLLSSQWQTGGRKICVA